MGRAIARLRELHHRGRPAERRDFDSREVIIAAVNTLRMRIVVVAQVVAGNRQFALTSMFPGWEYRHE